MFNRLTDDVSVNAHNHLYYLSDLYSTLVEFFRFFPQLFKRLLLRPSDVSNSRHLAKMLLRLVSAPVFVKQCAPFTLLETKYHRLAFPFAASFHTPTYILFPQNFFNDIVLETTLVGFAFPGLFFHSQESGMRKRHSRARGNNEMHGLTPVLPNFAMSNMRTVVDVQIRYRQREA